MSFFEGLAGYEVRKNVALAATPLVGTVTAAPFRLSEDGLGFQLRFSSDARVVVLRRWVRWCPLGRVLFDGSRCALSSAATVTVQGDADTVFEIRDSGGNRWLARYTFESEGLPLLDVSGLKLLAGPLSRSFVSHAGLALLVLLAFNAPRWVPGLDSFIERQNEKRIANIGAGRIGLDLPEPFSGGSIRVFEKAREDEIAAAEAAKLPAAQRTANAVGNLLARFKLGSFAGLGTAPAKKVARIDTSSIVASVMKGRVEASEKAGAAKQVTPAVENRQAQPAFNSQEAALRQSLDQIRPLLSRAFDEALRIDPGLSVTLAYEASVNEKGLISGVKFEARGKYSEVALRALEKNVRDALEGVRLGKEYSGTVLRGEQVFVR